MGYWDSPVKRRLQNKNTLSENKGTYYEQQEEEEEPRRTFSAAPLNSQVEGSSNPSMTATRNTPAPANFGTTGYQAPVVSWGDLPEQNYQNVNDFDFNKVYEQGLDQINRSKAHAQQQYDLAGQQDQEQLARFQRQLQQQQEQAFERQAERMASNGILRSGATVRGQSELGSQFQNTLDQYNQQRLAAQQQRESGYASFQEQLNNALASLQSEHTARQQAIEQQRAREAAEAAAAQEAAERARQAMPQMSPTGNFSPPQQQQQGQLFQVVNNGSSISGLTQQEAQAYANQGYTATPYSPANNPTGEGGNNAAFLALLAQLGIR